MQKRWLFYSHEEFAYTSCRSPWHVAQKLNTHLSDNGLLLDGTRIFNQLKQMLGGNLILEAALWHWQVHKRVLTVQPKDAKSNEKSIIWFFSHLGEEKQSLLMGNCSHFCIRGHFNCFKVWSKSEPWAERCCETVLIPQSKTCPLAECLTPRGAEKRLMADGCPGQEIYSGFAFLLNCRAKKWTTRSHCLRFATDCWGCF